jgi:hypothetical protein
MGYARQLGSLVVMAGFLVLTTATKQKRSEPAPDAAAASGSSAITAPAADAAPNDVDPRAVASTLGCASKVANAGCSLLDDFATASTWTQFPLSDDVWFGETNGIGGIADGKKELLYLQVTRRAGGFSASAHTLIAEDPKSAQDAAKLLAATRLGNPLPTSAAGTFMRSSSGGAMLPLLRTRGASQTLVQTPPQVFIRAKGDRVLIVEYTGNFLAHESAKGPGSALAWVGEVYRLR